MAMKQREVFARRVPLYRKNPCKFFAEVTGFAPDPWQKEAATAIAQHRKVSIRSGQGVGKTAFEANLVLWFLSCFPYPRVVCTAPTRQQLNDGPRLPSGRNAALSCRLCLFGQRPAFT